MHRVLRIDEVLQNIFSHISHIFIPPTRYKARKKILYNIVLVCRAFVEPANDVLWRELDSLLPLLCCLPRDVFRPPRKWDDPAVFGRAPEPSEWARFQHHARRVKSLSITADYFAQYHAEAIEMLQKHGPRPILPRLITLVWGDHKLVRYLPLFARETLLALQCSPQDDAELRTILHCMQTSTPRLRKLTMEDYSDEFESEPSMFFNMRKEVARCVTTLNHLTAMYYIYPNLPLESVVHFSRAPCLSGVALHLDIGNQHAPLSPAWSGFPALTTLKLIHGPEIANYTCVTTFIPRLSGAHLTRLHIEIETPAHDDEFRQLVSTVSLLKRLEACRMSFGPFDAWGDLVIDGTALAPLYGLADMRRFQLDGIPIVFAPHAVYTLTRAWGLLEHLQLYTGMGTVCHMSLDDLVYIAENCPALHHLSLRVWPVADDWRCDPGLPVSSSRLSGIGLQGSIIDPRAEEQVTEYFAKIFPLTPVGHIFYAGRRERAIAVMTWICEWKEMLMLQGMVGMAA